MIAYCFWIFLDVNTSLSRMIRVIAVHTDLCSGILSIKHGITYFQRGRFIFLPGANGHYSTLLWFFFSSVRNDQATSCLGFRRSRFDHHPVSQRLDGDFAFLDISGIWF